MSERVWVGTRKGLFEIARQSGGWKIQKLHLRGDPVSMVLEDPRDQAIYAAVSLGHFGTKLHRSTDRGASWQLCGAPTYPKKPEGLVDTDANGKTINWNTELVWALEPGAAAQAGRLWCGTIPGGLFRSDDHGDSWNLVRSLWDRPERKQWSGGGADLPGIHSIALHPSDGNQLAIGVSTGGVWRTRDGGESWTVKSSGMRAEYLPPERAGDPIAQDVHRMVRCAAKPEVLWAQHHCGVWRSTDDCESWQEVKVQPSSFGFAVAVHPRDPDRAWFVPAVKDEMRIPVDGKVVVARTTDGGKSFEVLTRGLPQEHAYDLVFRHALDIDGSGDRLCFGSTTGSLWISENQGDVWSAVSEHLPPIYCVRFGG